MAVASDVNPVVEWLVRAGVLQEGDEATRVIIDIQQGEAVRVYVNRYADQRMFECEPPDLSEAVVTVSDVEDNT